VVILLGAIAFHIASVILLFGGARWLGTQRRLGYPDPRAAAIDRGRVLVTVGVAWIWAQAFVLAGALYFAARAA
jgi:hypothetical protein